VTSSDIVFESDFNAEEVQQYLKGFLLANYKFKMTGIDLDTATVTEEEKKALFEPISKINIISKNNEISTQSNDFKFIERAAYYTLYAR